MTGEVLFNQYYTDDEVVDDGLVWSKGAKQDIIANVEEILELNTKHMADDADDPDDILRIPKDVVENNKFKRVIARMKGEKGFAVDVTYQYKIGESADELYWNCRHKKIGRKEYEQILDDVGLIFDIYSIDNYYFMFLIGDDNVIYGFIGSN